MVSTTLLKRRLGPARREEAQVAVRAMGAKPTHKAAGRASQASSLQSCPQRCPDCVSVLQSKGLWCAGFNRKRNGFGAPFVKTEKVKESVSLLQPLWGTCGHPEEKGECMSQSEGGNYGLTVCPAETLRLLNETGSQYHELHQNWCAEQPF